MLCMAYLYANNQLITSVIFTPVVTLETRKYSVDTSVDTIILNFSENKIRKPQ